MRHRKRLMWGCVRSCGCMKTGHPTPQVNGKRFGMLVILKYIPGSNGKPAKCVCRCDCGATATKTWSSIQQRHTTSCGCYFQKHFRKHRQSRTRFYKIWGGMIQRCENMNDRAWRRYGGSGITVCRKWRKSFEAFAADMGPPPKGASLDRINNFKGYSPSNCRWATPKQQTRNRTTTKFVTFNRRTMAIGDWAEEYKISYWALLHRINNGWSVKRALTQPVRQTRRRTASSA